MKPLGNESTLVQVPVGMFACAHAHMVGKQGALKKSAHIERELHQLLIGSIRAIDDGRLDSLILQLSSLATCNTPPRVLTVP